MLFLIQNTSLSCPPLHPDVLHYCTPCIMRAICYLLCPPSGSRHEADFPNKIHEHISSKKANYLTNSCLYQRLFFFLIDFFYIEHHAWSWFWKGCMTLQRCYTFSFSIYFFYAFTLQHFIPLLFHHAFNKDSKLWSNIEAYYFFKETKLNNFRHGLTFQLPNKDFSMFCGFNFGLILVYFMEKKCLF